MEKFIKTVSSVKFIENCGFYLILALSVAKVYFFPTFYKVLVIIVHSNSIATHLTSNQFPKSLVVPPYKAKLMISLLFFVFWPISILWAPSLHIRDLSISTYLSVVEVNSVHTKYFP